MVEPVGLEPTAGECRVPRAANLLTPLFGLRPACFCASQSDTRAGVFLPSVRRTGFLHWLLALVRARPLASCAINFYNHVTTVADGCWHFSCGFLSMQMLAGGWFMLRSGRRMLVRGQGMLRNGRNYAWFKLELKFGLSRTIFVIVPSFCSRLLGSLLII